MSDVILLGEDADGLGERFDAAALSVTTLGADPIGDTLVEAGIATAGAVVLTTPRHASLIPVARDLNPEVTIVLYSEGRLPPFASAQADLSVDRALVDADDLVEAVVDRIEAAG